MKFYAILLMAAVAPAAFAGSTVQKIDADENGARYVVSFETTTGGGSLLVMASRTKDDALAGVLKRSKDLCRRLGWDWYRYAELAEIINDETLKAAWEISGGEPESGFAHKRAAKIVIFSKERETGSRSCMTDEEIKKAAIAARKEERKAEKAKRKEERRARKADKEGGGTSG